MFDLDFGTPHFYIYIMKVKIYFVFGVYIFSFFIINFTKMPLADADVDQFVEYRVEIGDTLWEIGKKMNITNYEKFIYEVEKLNNLVNSKIVVNEIILIPLNT